MFFLSEIVGIVGLLVLLAGLVMRRPVLSSWGGATLAIGIALFWTSAVLTDHDNIEHGRRLERLIIPTVLVLLAVAYATRRTVRRRRAGQFTGQIR